MRKETTNLYDIRQDANAASYGYAERIYDFGPYTFVEAEDVDGRVLFHIYFEGEYSNLYATSIEQAMIGAIAHGSFPGNREAAGNATTEACKILEVEG